LAGFLWGYIPTPLQGYQKPGPANQFHLVKVKLDIFSALCCVAINSLNKVFIFAINFISFFMNKLYGCNGFADFSLFAICAPFNIIRAAKEDGWMDGWMDKWKDDDDDDG